MNQVLSQLAWYLPALWRRRWHIVAIAWVICLGGWAATALIPDEYEAQAKVHIDTESLLRPLLRGLAVEINPMQQVQIMQRTLVTRTSLERVMRMTDLDLKARTEEDTARLIGELQDSISLASDRANIFTISYADQNPQMAYKVVQALLSVFMENNAGNTRREFDSARRFIDDQLNKYLQEMQDAENRLNQFKTENLSYLPGNATFVDHMNSTRNTLRGLEERLAEEQARADEIRKQLTEVPEYTEMPMLDSRPPTGIEMRIMDLEHKLDGLLLQYTDKHPDVINTRALLERLQQELNGGGEGVAAASLTAAPPSGLPADGAAAMPEAVPDPQQELRDLAAAGFTRVPNEVYRALRVSLANAESQIAAMKSSIERKREELETLRTQVNLMPEIQGQLDRLTRDYTMARRSYEELLQRRQTADLSESREVNADKVQMRVIDPPQVPVLPAGFKRPLMLSAVLFGGLGAGLGIAILLASLQPNFVSTQRLSHLVGMPVLGSISMVRRETRMARFARLGSFGGALMGLVALYAGLMVIEVNVGLPNAVPADMRADIAQRAGAIMEMVR